MGYRKNRQSSGHDNTISLDVVQSALQSSIRMGDTQKITVDYETDVPSTVNTEVVELFTSAICASELCLSSSNTKSVWKTLFTAFQEDLGPVIPPEGITLFLEFWKSFSGNSASKSTKNLLAKDDVNASQARIDLLSAVMYMTYLPTCRMASTAFPVVMSSISLVAGAMEMTGDGMIEAPANLGDGTDLAEEFARVILRKDSVWGTSMMDQDGRSIEELRVAWNMVVLASEQKPEAALRQFCVLWLKIPPKPTKNKKKEVVMRQNSHFSKFSSNDVKDLIWDSLSLLLCNVGPYREGAEFFTKHCADPNGDSSGERLWFTSAVLRASTSSVFAQVELADKIEECINFAYKAARRKAREHEMILFDPDFKFNIEIQDRFKDMRTKEGRDMGRGYEHFVRCASVTGRNMRGVPDIFEERWVLLYCSHNKRKGSLTKAVMKALLREYADHMGVPHDKTVVTKPDEAGQHREYSGSTLVVSRDVSGSHVGNEPSMNIHKPDSVVTSKKRKYADPLEPVSASRKYKESDIFITPVRSHIRTSPSKPHSYYATVYQNFDFIGEETGNQEGSCSCFVRGPYPLDSRSRNDGFPSLVVSLISDTLKRHLDPINLFSVHSRMVYLVPDLFLNPKLKSPASAHPFIISDDLIGYQTKRSEVKTSVTEAPMGVSVILMNQPGDSMRHPDAKEAEAWEDDTVFNFLAMLVYRYCMEITDTGPKSILVNDMLGRVYSVDESNMFANVDGKPRTWKFGKDWYRVFKKNGERNLEEFWEGLIGICKKWRKRLTTDSSAKMFMLENRLPIDRFLRNLDVIMDSSDVLLEMIATTPSRTKKSGDE